MPIYRFIDSLSFKQKITFGFTALILIMGIGMSYMLVQYTKMSEMTTEIIERYQPVTNLTREAIKHTQASVNLLHEHLLDNDLTKIDNQMIIMDQLKDDIVTLIEYADIQELSLNKKELFRAITINDEISRYIVKIKELSSDYNKNHPVITYATETLNPIGLEYLGFINQIIDESLELGLSLDAVIALSNMRYSWSQVMSHMRTVITTRNPGAIINVYTYSNTNKQQFEKIQDMNLDLGIYELFELDNLREQYLVKLEYVREKLKLETWREDSRIMINNVMPLYNELKIILNNTLMIETKNSEKAYTILTDEISNIELIYSILIISGISLAFIISVFITRSLRRPLRLLVTATKDIASGNFETHVNTTSGDEISQLNNSFNEMVVKLKRYKNELINSKEDAEKASQFKSQFLRSMSHELRTPMNAVLGYSQLLEMEPLTDEQKIFVNEISKSGNHLLDLINQVLDLARIESGKTKTDLEAIQLAELIKDCIPLLSCSSSRSRDIKIINNTDNLDYTIISDRLNLRQVIINLLSNAVKYNKDNGTITIDAEELNNEMIKISITDTGVGLNPDEIKNIYEPFQRLSFMNSSVEGSGIGLTITKRLIEEMGGDMGIESTKGIGSTFWFTLPSTKYVCLVDNYTSNDTETTDNKAIESRKITEILYIEDNPVNLGLMKAIFSTCDSIKLNFATTAEDGLKLIETTQPDIILMDISLPGMSGHEALTILKNNNSTQHIPVIAVSAHALTHDVSNDLNSGFDHYITKPIDISQLKNTISQYT